MFIAVTEATLFVWSGSDWSCFLWWWKKWLRQPNSVEVEITEAALLGGFSASFDRYRISWFQREFTLFSIRRLLFANELASHCIDSIGLFPWIGAVVAPDKRTGMNEVEWVAFWDADDGELEWSIKHFEWNRTIFKWQRKCAIKDSAIPTESLCHRELYK